MRLVAIRRDPTFNWAVAVLSCSGAMRPLVVARFTRVDGRGVAASGSAVGVSWRASGSRSAPVVGPGVDERGLDLDAPTWLLDATVIEAEVVDAAGDRRAGDGLAVASVCVQL